MTTEAPFNFISLEKYKFADSLSKRVLPKKVPNPVPELELTCIDLDFIYGSPIISIISSGNPGPSSFILICIYLSSLVKMISTRLLENLIELPIKFLSP